MTDPALDPSRTPLAKGEKAEASQHAWSIVKAVVALVILVVALVVAIGGLVGLVVLGSDFVGTWRGH